MAKDYYDILGVSKNASQDEIKAAFRKLAHQHHPDKSGGDEKKFKEVNEAYQVVGNPEKRKQYDQFGSTFEQAQSQGGYSGFNGFRDFSGFADAFRNGNNGAQNFEFDLGDIFGDFFGGGQRTRTKTGRTSHGSDMEMEIAIDFRDAIFGTEKEIEFTRNGKCDICSGSGAEPGSRVIKCSTCKGSGQVVKTMGFGFGFSSVCPECQGVGEKYDKVCKKCHATGVVKEKRKLTVKIPAGIENGQSIRLSGEGESDPRGGKAGDLYIHIKVKTHPRFVREANNIISKEDITFSKAGLGGSLDVETIDGRVELHIPEGTQSGTTFKLRGKGVPFLQGHGRGDHLVEVIVRTPSRLSRRQKQMLEDFDKE